MKKEGRVEETSNVT